MNVVDLFAGAGGFSEGALAAGCTVLWAANHWKAAVACHSANHPTTQHECQDLHQANWLDVPAHDMLLASPACQGHSPARGKERPHHDATRSTAWAVVSAAEAHRPPVVIVENVPAFADWVLYPAWCEAMRRLGYQIAPHTLDAADSGVPQHRVRMFLVCTRSRAPLMLWLSPRQHRAYADIIDTQADNWSPIAKDGRSAATLARVAAGRKRYGHRFVMPYYGSGSGETGRSLARPLGTVTTRDRWALVEGDNMRMLTVNEYRAAMSFRPDYVLPASGKLAKHLLGNAVCPAQAEHLISAVRAAA